MTARNKCPGHAVALKLDSSNGVLSPRLFFKESPSARMSKGSLFILTRVTSETARFKQIASKISRRTALFEPRQVWAAFWLRSKTASADCAFWIEFCKGGLGLADPGDLVP